MMLFFDDKIIINRIGQVIAIKHYLYPSRLSTFLSIWLDKHFQGIEIKQNTKEEHLIQMERSLPLTARIWL